MTGTVWRTTLVVLRKELRDALRDRRGLLTVFFSVMLGPVIIGVMMNRLADRQRDAEDIRLPVVGAGHAPALVEWLQGQPGVEVTKGPEDPEAAVRSRTEALVLVIAPDFADRFRQSRPAPVTVISDSSRNDARPAVERVHDLLNRYSGEIASLRLIGRGVSPVIATPLRVEEIEVSSAQQRAATLLGFIPLFIVLAAFTGGMQIATDSTAGERERGSLEPLLVNPAPRAALACGKWLAATSTAMLSALLSTMLCLLLFRLVPLEDMGIRFRFGWPQFLGILAVVLPFCPLSAAVQSCIGIASKSFKEAQSYLALVMFVPMLPGLITTMYPMTSETWMYPVPVLGHHAMLTGVLGAHPPAAVWFIASAAASLAVAALVMYIATRLLYSERIIFGR